jgi:hypothetical protein
MNKKFLRKIISILLVFLILCPLLVDPNGSYAEAINNAIRIPISIISLVIAIIAQVFLSNTPGLFFMVLWFISTPLFVIFLSIIGFILYIGIHKILQKIIHD